MSDCSDDDSNYYIQNIRPKRIPNFYPPIYDPGFEPTEANAFQCPTHYVIEYDPGFSIQIKVKPISIPKENIEGSLSYETPYDPGFTLTECGETGESSCSSESETEDVTPSAPIAICPPYIEPANRAVPFDPEFENQPKYGIYPSMAALSYPSYPERDNMPPIKNSPKSYAISYFPGFQLPEANLYNVSLSYPTFPLLPAVTFPPVSRNCEPSCAPPPIGFVYGTPIEEILSQYEEGVLADNVKPYRWAPASCSDCSKPNALLVGHDQDGSPIYAGRAYHNGDVLPAKVIPCKSVAYVAYNGEEIIKDQFEVLCQSTLTWVWAAGGTVPAGSIQIGNTADGESLYLGRVHYDGSITPGKIHPSHGCCYFPFGGEEKSAVDYEVLVAQ